MISLLIAFSGASVAEQMAPAQRGELQCQMPDVLFKTCFSLSKVVRTGPTTYRFETRMLISKNDPVVMAIDQIATVQGQEVCARLTLSDLSKAKITLGGKELPAANSARYFSLLRRQYAAVQGKLICTEIVANEQGMEKVQGRIDGKRVSALDYAMIWVRPDDGWVVGE
jgi:hypothetical protein